MVLEAQELSLRRVEFLIQKARFSTAIATA